MVAVLTHVPLLFVILRRPSATAASAWCSSSYGRSAHQQQRIDASRHRLDD
jgi:hypothetical protein